jgi:hypothetical protein
VTEQPRYFVERERGEGQAGSAVTQIVESERFHSLGVEANLACVHFFDQTLSGSPRALRSHLRDTADAAEEAGCTMFTCMDQYFQMEAFTRAEDPMLEGYTSTHSSTR